MTAAITPSAGLPAGAMGATAAAASVPAERRSFAEIMSGLAGAARGGQGDGAASGETPGRARTEPPQGEPASILPKAGELPEDADPVPPGQSAPVVRQANAPGETLASRSGPPRVDAGKASPQACRPTVPPPSRESAREPSDDPHGSAAAVEASNLPSPRASDPVDSGGTSFGAGPADGSSGITPDEGSCRCAAAEDAPLRSPITDMADGRGEPAEPPTPSHRDMPAIRAGGPVVASAAPVAPARPVEGPAAVATRRVDPGEMPAPRGPRRDPESQGPASGEKRPLASRVSGETGFMDRQEPVERDGRQLARALAEIFNAHGFFHQGARYRFEAAPLPGGPASHEHSAATSPAAIARPLTGLAPAWHPASPEAGKVAARAWPSPQPAGALEAPRPDVPVAAPLRTGASGIAGAATHPAGASRAGASSLAAPGARPIPARESAGDPHSVERRRPVRAPARQPFDGESAVRLSIEVAGQEVGLVARLDRMSREDRARLREEAARLLAAYGLEPGEIRINGAVETGPGA